MSVHKPVTPLRIGRTKTTCSEAEFSDVIGTKDYSQSTPTNGFYSSLPLEQKCFRTGL
jgi:hypothetical protein